MTRISSCCRPRYEVTAVAPYSAGMIEQLEEMPPGTLGFRAAGHITREDYSGLLVPALRAAVEGGAPLRTLYLIEEMTGIEPSALWSDAQLGFDLGVRHH